MQWYTTNCASMQVATSLRAVRSRGGTTVDKLSSLPARAAIRCDIILQCATPSVTRASHLGGRSAARCALKPAAESAWRPAHPFAHVCHCGFASRRIGRSDCQRDEIASCTQVQSLCRCSASYAMEDQVQEVSRCHRHRRRVCARAELIAPARLPAPSGQEPAGPQRAAVLGGGTGPAGRREPPDRARLPRSPLQHAAQCGAAPPSLHRPAPPALPLHPHRPSSCWHRAQTLRRRTSAASPPPTTQPARTMRLCCSTWRPRA